MGQGTGQTVVPQLQESPLTPGLDVPVRVLLVDDNSFNRKIGSLQIERLGHHVDSVADGQSAITLCYFHRYDLVLMDLEMPELDGFETTRTLRELLGSDSSRILILALTARSSPRDVERAVAAGMDGFLTKPLDESSLRQAILNSRTQIKNRPTPGWNSWALEPETIRSSYPMSRESMIQVVQLFRESCAERIREIRQAFEREDSDEVARQIHALRGSLGMFASSRTLDLARDLENKARSAKLRLASGIFPLLEEAILRLQPVLDLLIEGKPPEVRGGLLGGEISGVPGPPRLG